jgi:rhodanese-related sulfurtransferase
MIGELQLYDSSPLRLLTVTQLVEKIRGGAVVLDTRPAEQFSARHIRGSIQISLMGNFASWAAMIIDPAQKLALVAENAQRAQEAHNRLVRVGLRNIVGYAVADENQWREAGLELASIAIDRCEHILGILRPDSSLQLVDVRSRAEWLKGHLPGAISMPLLDLNPEKNVIDPSKPSLVYCHEGYRATTAASLLLRESAGEVGILIDGIEGWSALGLPLEMPSFDRLFPRTNENPSK